MNRLIVFLFSILFCTSYVGAQQMVNYNFSSFAGTMSTLGTPPTSCAYWTSSNLLNWFITGGTPEWHSSGPYQYIHIFTEQEGYYTEWESFAGHYNFISGHTYFLQIGIADFRAGGIGCDNNLKVVATNGLVEILPSMAVGCGGPLPIPSSSESIGDFVSSIPVSNKVFTVIYTPTMDFHQILLYSNTCSRYTALYVDIDSVSIRSCSDVKDKTIDYTSSNQLAGGVQVLYSTITAGSSSSGIAAVDPSNTTIFAGEAINLVPNFSAQINKGNYFLAQPMKGCEQCAEITGDGEIPCYHYTTTIPISLSCATSGGTWSSSNPLLASVDAAGVVTAHPPYLTGTVTITYTTQYCVVTKTILLDICGNKLGGNNISAGNSSNTANTDIQVYPSPATDKINIAYPCNSAGQLEINIKDISGRVMREESIMCTENNEVQHTVDINTFPSGIYFISLTLNDQHTVKKIVKL